MFAVVFIGGKQYKVREKDEFQVEKLDLEAGKNLKIKEVLLLSDEDADAKVGMPYVAGAHVECQVLEHGKGEKIRIFKMHAKKRYSLRQGHRQNFTTLKVMKISALGKKSSEKAEVAEEKAKVAEEKPVAKKAPAKKAAPKKKA